MPKPEEKNKEERVIIEDDSEIKEPQDDGIEIPLDDNGEPLSPEAKKKRQEEDSKSKEEEQHKKNAEFAQRRIDQDKQRLKQQLDEANRRLANLEKKNSMPDFGIMNNRPVVKDDAYWEKRLAEAPVQALREFEEHRYNERLQQQMEMQERQKMLESWQTTLVESKNMAVEEFPSLEQEGSPEYDMFMSVLDKHPEWRNSPIGPMKVVKEMKKLMANGKGGNDVISKVRAEAETNERNRQARIVNQPLSSSRPAPSNNKIVLTREQMAEWQNNFKDRGVTLERYAQMVNRTQKGGEVIV